MLDFAKELLKKHYCKPNESIAEAFRRASDCYATDSMHSERLQEYLAKEWFMEIENQNVQHASNVG